ncbi:MAG: dTMP kinase [Herpetosiphonaceae bacterium]|nr:dTMP kinase [Herpetosiphonaceae bacterium]
MSLFVTFEGPEGSGKSTQARYLKEYLQNAGYPAILTREPGGTPISDAVRRLVLDGQWTSMEPTTETLLFAAARAQLVGEVIMPYLNLGGIVVCDRYADSTYAYQGYGLGRNLTELREITRFATGGLQPDLTIYLDLPVDEGLSRKQRQRDETRELNQLALPLPHLPPPQPSQSEHWNRLDAREVAYHERVRNGYLEMIAADPDRWQVLDARVDREVLTTQIIAAIQPALATIKPL